MASAKLHCPSSIITYTKSTSFSLLQNNNNVTQFPNMGFSKIKGTRRSMSQNSRIIIVNNNALNNKTNNTVGVVVNEKKDGGNNNVVIIEGTVIVIEKTVLGLFKDFGASLVDRFDEMATGRKVCFELVSAAADIGHPGNEMRGQGKRSRPTCVDNWIVSSPGVNPTESGFKLKFELDADFGVPGALIVRNEHHSEFYLESVSLHGFPNHDHQLHFGCNSWVYPTFRYKNMYRIFFRNQAYLPAETPVALRGYRDKELETLRGNGDGKLEEWDRVYDYAYYNDLGNPDKGSGHARPVLGGSEDYPYPRRGRTGRSPSKTDENSESRLPYAMSLDIYVPKDEKFGPLKMADYMSHSLKAVLHALQAGLNALFNKTPTEFGCLDDTLKLYKHEIKLLDPPSGLEQKTTFDILKEFFHLDNVPHLKFPVPHIIREDKSAWTSDEEFAREMLAGVNPVVIRRLEVFPPISELDPEQYGDHTSTITEDHIQKNLQGLSVDEAMKKKKMFILDHHDALMPYLRRINTTETKTYATRTLLFLKDDGTLKPLAIELSLPHPNGDEFGAVSKVYTPAEGGVDGCIWQLAKVYVSVNDSGYHQLVCHWLNTHAVIEPFVIASNRQLSVLHPIHKLLCPHFRDTMYINALARQILIGAGGILEQTVFPGKYALEMSSAVYKDWVFTDQALPADLIKRGMAEKDPDSPHGYKLFIEDYPFAVDGLSIWSAIEEWVTTYCRFYYKNSAMITNDTELQSWWKEIRNEGHGDLKHKSWWPELTTIEVLIQTCTTIIWIASALHAAVNFGQYPYAGYLPNRPTTSRRFMPEPRTPEHEELETDPENVLLKTITSQWKTLLGVSLIEILSTHTSDEVYLGRREDEESVFDDGPVEGFKRFNRRLEEIEGEIEERNKKGELRNRTGPVNMPYTLLMPTSDAGVTARGIPNSISI